MPLPHDSMFFGFAHKLTEEQKIYVDSIFDNQLTIVNAKSGSGKTTLAVAAAKLLGKDLVYIFTPVEEGKMGYRPGTQEEKERSYTAPLIDALQEINENPMQVIYSEDMMCDPKYRKKMTDGMKNGAVWVYPKSHTFARGTNIKDCIVIVDEAQNFSLCELKKVLTRCHDSAKVVLIGHTGQIDLADPKKSGFTAYLEHFRNEPYAKVCELTKNFRGQLAQHADNLN